jgi:hypothetical protein
VSIQYSGYMRPEVKPNRRRFVVHRFAVSFARPLAIVAPRQDTIKKFRVTSAFSLTTPSPSAARKEETPCHCTPGQKLVSQDRGDEPARVPLKWIRQE